MDRVQRGCLDVLRAAHDRPTSALEVVRAWRGDGGVAKPAVNRALYELMRRGLVQKVTADGTPVGPGEAVPKPCWRLTAAAVLADFEELVYV